MATHWVPLHGEFVDEPDGIRFSGGTSESGGQKTAKAGIALSNLRFGSGTVSAVVEFADINPNSVAEIILWYDPQTRNMLTVGIGGGGYMCAIRIYNDANLSGAKWVYLASVGTATNLKPKRKYDISAELAGSKLMLSVDGVLALTTILTVPLTESQVGMFCLGDSDCTITSFGVSGGKARAFVVMQFTTEYQEVYEEVIKPAVGDLGLNVRKADETHGPGLIIADIIAKLVDARVVIADVSVPNPNVYFEVGYSFAIGKPPILIALDGTELPFDVSPFRTLFYKNTIKGKKALEEGLKGHVRAVLGLPPVESAA